MRQIHQGVIGLMAVVLSSVAVQAQPPKVVGQERPGLMQDWESRLVLADNLERQGEHKKAFKITESLIDEMLRSIESGPAGPLLGRTVVLRAVAEAGLGRTEQAAWDWFAAQVVDPDLTVPVLTRFGATGEQLRSAIASTPELPDLKPSGTSSDDPPGGHVSRPEKIGGNLPKYPAAAAEACHQGKMVLEAMIDERGKVLRPTRLETPGGPVLTLATLEALKTWKFRPARQAGKPVPVRYTLTTSYVVGTCRNAAAVASRKKG